MKLWLILLLGLGLLVSATVSEADSAPVNHESALRTVIQQFFQAFQRADLPAALNLTTVDPDERAWVRDYLQQEFAAGSDYRFQLERFTVREVDDPFAVVRARMAWEWLTKGQTERQKGKQSWDFALLLEREGWKIRGFRYAEANLLAQFKAAVDAPARAVLLKREAAIVDGWLPLSLRDQADELSRADKHEEAERVATLAFEVAEWMNDDYERAYCHLTRGAVRRRAKQWNPALDDWDHALELFKKSGNSEGMAKAWRNAAALYHHLAKFDRAVEAYEKSIRYWREVKDTKSEADMLQDLGVVHQDAGRPDAAGQLYQQALEIQTKLGNLKRQAQLLGNIAAIRQDQERYVEALELYERANGIYAQLQDHSGESVFLTNLGNLYDMLGQEEEAEKYHARAVASASRSTDRRDLMIALHNQSNFYMRQGRPDPAIEKGIASAKVASEIGDRRFEAQSLNSVAELFFREREWERALGLYQDALEVSQDAGNRIQECVATAGLAGCHVRLRHTGRALHYFAEARKLTGPAGDMMLQMNAARLEAELHYDNGDLPRAVQLYRRAIAVVERVRSQNAVRTLQTSYLRQYIFLYQRLADCLVRLGDLRGAFAVSEQLRARGLVDVIRSGMFRITKAMSDAERTQEAELEERLRSVSRSLEKAVLTEDRDRLQEQQAEARLQLEKLQELLYARHPQLRTQRADFEAATPEELNRGILSRAPRAALLSYFVLPERTLLFVLRRSATGEAVLRMHSLPVKAGELSRRSEALWMACSTPGGEYRAAAKSLYRDLIQPVLADLKGTDHLVLIAGTELGNLPFSALLDERDAPLVSRFALSYALSATALMYQAEISPGAAVAAGQYPLLAFGNPVFPKNLSELPATEGEVFEIQRLFGAKARAFIRKDALESRAKQLLGAARIVHFATHGTLDESAPMYSSIILTSDDHEDGFLQARELAEMDLHADLVVLSACETALGQKVRGEGVVGLAWALFVGGAQSTLASQWQVPDESTRTLMVQFYRRLLRPGVGRAEAIRQAQLALQKDKRYAHPYHWAPFTLSGQWSSEARREPAGVSRN